MSGGLTRGLPLGMVLTCESVNDSLPALVSGRVTRNGSFDEPVDHGLGDGLERASPHHFTRG